MSPSASIYTSFYSQSYGDFSSWHWNLGSGAWCEAGTPCFSGRTSVAKISLPICICYTSMWAQPVPCLHPFYHSLCGFFCNSLVVGLPLSQISGSSERWLLCSSVVILTWLWEEASTTFTSTTILTGSLAL